MMTRAPFNDGNTSDTPFLAGERGHVKQHLVTNACTMSSSYQCHGRSVSYVCFRDVSIQMNMQLPALVTV